MDPVLPSPLSPWAVPSPRWDLNPTPISQCPHTVTSPVTEDTNFSDQTPFVPTIRCPSPPLPTLRALPRASPCCPQLCPIPPCCPPVLSSSPARLGRPLMLLLCCVSVWVLGCWVGSGVGTVGGDLWVGRGLGLGLCCDVAPNDGFLLPARPGCLQAMVSALLGVSRGLGFMEKGCAGLGTLFFFPTVLGPVQESGNHIRVGLQHLEQ